MELGERSARDSVVSVAWEGVTDTLRKVMKYNSVFAGE